MLDLPINFDNERLPPVSGGLIIWLKDTFPDRMPDDDDILDIKFKQGQLSVVRALAGIYEETK